MNNIILIGMMGSGKTLIGQALGKKTLMPFIDIYATIEDKEKTIISNLFSQYGELYFRKLETQAVHQASFAKDTVIATGGGVVLNPQNMEILSKCGVVVYLQATLGTLQKRVQADPNRPLANKLEDLFKQREPLYKKYSDFTIDANCKPDKVLEMILREYRNNKRT